MFASSFLRFIDPDVRTETRPQFKKVAQKKAATVWPRSSATTVRPPMIEHACRKNLQAGVRPLKNLSILKRIVSEVFGMKTSENMKPANNFWKITWFMAVLTNHHLLLLCCFLSSFWMIMIWFQDVSGNFQEETMAIDNSLEV